MNWLKRNLFWVVGGVVAFGLLGVAVWYLYSSLQSEKDIDQQLGENRQKLEQLNNANPHPGRGGVDNIAAAKEDLKRLEAFLKEIRQFVQPVPVVEPKDSRDFKLLLNNTLFDLGKDAEAANVTLPAKPYPFTFKAQSEATQFETNQLMPLAIQLAEIKSICELLFKAKVHSIESIKRVPSKDETGTADYLTGKTPTTNTLTIHTPYEFSFKGFSAELAGVVDGLARSPHCFLIKQFHVIATTPVSSTPGETPAIPMYGGGSAAMMMQMQMMNRYGGRYGRMPMAPPPDPAQLAAPPPKPGITNILDEKPLKVTLLVEAVRPKPAK